MMKNLVIKRVAKRVLSPLLSPMRPGNVVMLHIGRCGSSVVGQLLGQHPRIYWASELYAPIFSEWQRRNSGEEMVGEMPEDALSYLQRNMRAALHRFYGFEMKPFHFRLIGYSAEAFLDHLDSVGFNHFILLDRRNRLRKIISSVIAHSRDGDYHIGSERSARLTKAHVNIDDLRIDFDSKPLIEYLADYDREMHGLETLLRRRNVLRLTYEDDIQADPQRAYARVCDFLGLRATSVSPKLSRTNPFPLEDMIENFGEVKQTLAGTPYEWMLED